MLAATTAPAPTYDGALGYLRNKVASFRHLGTVELPALRAAVTKAWLAARENGNDPAREAQAHALFDRVTALQGRWEEDNDTLQSVLAPLRAVGVQLGILPAAWVVATVIALAASIYIVFETRDKLAGDVSTFLSAAVNRGELTPQEAARLALQYRQASGGTSLGSGLVAVAAVAAAIWFLPRKQG